MNQIVTDKNNNHNVQYLNPEFSIEFEVSVLRTHCQFHLAIHLDDMVRMVYDIRYNVMVTTPISSSLLLAS